MKNLLMALAPQSKVFTLLYILNFAMTEHEERTYQQEFQYYLQKYEAEHHEPVGTEPKRSYTLYEDLKLIMACSQLNEVHNKDFKALEAAGVVQRSHQSIRDRFRSFLAQLTQDDLEKIIAHLRQYGAQGYLIFSTNEVKQFLSISLTDPKSLQNQQERRRQTESLGLTKKQFVDAGNLTNEQLDQQILREFEQLEGQLTTDQTTKKTKKKFDDKTFPKNAKDKFSPKELEKFLGLLAEWKGIPKSALVIRLHQLCANLGDLDDFLLTNNDKNLWFEEEDELLMKAKSRDSPEIRLLIRQKGLERVLRRIKYLGIVLPFDLD